MRVVVFVLALAIFVNSLRFPEAINPDVGTDAHIDLNYSVGAEADCSRETLETAADMCCRPRKVPAVKVPAGLFGSPRRHCDVPQRTFEATLRFMHRTLPNPDAVIYTGDSPAHDTIDSFQSQTGPLNVLHVLLVPRRLHETFNNGTKNSNISILPIIGNVDPFPGEMLGRPPFSTFMLDPLGDLLESMGSLEASEAAMFRRDGVYSHMIPGTKVRVLGLSTQYVCGVNVFMWNWPWEKTHPMLEWFISELKDARANGHKVVIIGHIPPSNMDLFDGWNQAFVELMEEFNDVVMLQLLGHEHDDRFGITRASGSVSSPGRATGVYLVSSSVTTKTDKNPSVRLISYSKSESRVLDVVTYYNDIEKSNLDGRMDTNWHEEYSMSTFYRLQNFSALEFDNVIQRLETDEDFWDKFVLYHDASFKPPKKCHGSCKVKLICEMKFTRHSLIQDCLEKGLAKY